MKLCTAVQEGCGYKDALRAHRYFAPLAKHFTVCITYHLAYVYWLMGRCSALSIQNKLTLYKQILMPVWTDGIQLWRWTRQSNIDIIHRFQKKVLKNIVVEPWYIRRVDLHRDLQMENGYE
jgi:hypothetical protein